MVYMATYNMILKNWGVPTKSIISHVLPILDFLAWLKDAGPSSYCHSCKLSYMYSLHIHEY